MKKLALVLSLVLMLTFVGCSSKTTVKETGAFRFDSKTGYAYSTAPFGIDTTELESAIGSKLAMVSESPATAPFAYTNYSSEDIVQSADCSGKFDAQFDEIAAAVASGILNVIDDDMDRRPVEESDYYYQIQTGAYRIRSLAEQQLEELRRMGFPAFLVYDGTYFKLRVGAFKNLDNAVRMERELRKAGFPTVLLYEREVK